MSAVLRAARVKFRVFFYVVGDENPNFLKLVPSAVACILCTFELGVCPKSSRFDGVIVVKFDFHMRTA